MEWLNGVSVVIGALIAAFAGFASPFILAHIQDSRRDEATRQHLVGASRVLFEQFLLIQEELVVKASDYRIRPFDPSFQISMPPGDLRLIAQRLPPEGWAAVMTALEHVPADRMFLDTLIREGHRSLRPRDKCILHSDEVDVELASRSLAPLADAPGRPPVPMPVDCSKYFH